MQPSAYFNAARLIESEFTKHPDKVIDARTETDVRKYLEYHVLDQDSPIMNVWQVGHLVMPPGLQTKKIFFVGGFAAPGAVNKPYLFFNTEGPLPNNKGDSEQVSEWERDLKSGSAIIIEP